MKNKFKTLVAVVLLLVAIFLGILVLRESPPKDYGSEIEAKLEERAAEYDYAIVDLVSSEGDRLIVDVYSTDDLAKAQAIAKEVGAKEIVNLRDRANPIPVE